ncbi:MAG: bifunctional UDP-N-acetylglucosamine diphosphorylase/glucosamine-1-phosphate N-acetyltransferase GlmU [Desulfohalobiaceae bacterium]
MPDLQESNITVLILAAGKGTRMGSARPKVLQELLGEPMLWYVWRSVAELISQERIFVLSGYRSAEVQSIFKPGQARHVVQDEQLGTGHALLCALPQLLQTGARHCLVLNGDAPLLSSHSLSQFLDQVLEQTPDLAFMSIELQDPQGYGRVQRDDSAQVLGIVEDRDITDRRQELIQEVNAGVYLLNLQSMQECLYALDNSNQQGEYYITQLVDLGLQMGKRVAAVNAGANPEFLGVNNPAELVQCEEMLRKQVVHNLLSAGAIIRNPEQVRISPKSQVEPGSEITGPAEIYGSSYLAAQSCLESHIWIKDSQIGERARIRSFSHLEQAQVGQECHVGPYARLRPGAVLRSRAKAGNYVEIKKSELAEDCKVNHLAYIGDACVGAGSNIGAGTIICNYDGKHKHQTVIGENVFVGSNSSLVAPLQIGNNALIGAGSTITRDVPQGSLSVARGKQKNLRRRTKNQDQDE